MTPPLGAFKAGILGAAKPPAASAPPEELSYTGGDPESGTDYEVSVQPVLHFDAGKVTGVADGDPVTTWPDRSGNDYDGTSSGSDRPTYKASGQNSRPYLDFDGVDDYLEIASGGTVTGDFTLVVAGKRDLTNSYWIPLSTSGTAYKYYFGYWNNNAMYGFADFLFDSDVDHDMTSFDFVWMTRDGSDDILAYQTDYGSELHSGNWGTVASTGYKFIGARNETTPGRFLNGQLYEILLWNSLLSTADLNVVLDYLDNKYQRTSGGTSHTNFT